MCNEILFNKQGVLATIEKVVVETPLCEEDLQEGCCLMGDLSSLGLDIIAHLKKTKDILTKAL